MNNGLKTVAIAVALLFACGTASAMGDKELAKAMAKQSGLSTAQAEQAIEAFKAIVIAQVKTGEAVRLKGFGKFTLKQTKAHKGRNPKTGETIDIPARNHLRFKAFQAVKDQLNPKQ